jgi:hypothetical protein
LNSFSVDELFGTIVDLRDWRAGLRLGVGKITECFYPGENDKTPPTKGCGVLNYELTSYGIAERFSKDH